MKQLIVTPKQINLWRKNPKHQDWHYITERYKLNLKVISEFSDYVIWLKLASWQTLPEDFIEKHLDKLNWPSILIQQRLSEEFLRRHLPNLNWVLVSKFQKLSLNFISEFSSQVQWKYLFRNIFKKYKFETDFILHHLADIQKQCSLQDLEEYLDPRIRKAWEMLELLT